MRLGEQLVAEGLINRAQLEKGLQAQQQFQGRLGSTLAELGFLDLDIIARALSRKLGVPPVLRAHLANLDKNVVAGFPVHIAKRYSVMPLGLAATGHRVVVAFMDPHPENVQAVQFALGKRVQAGVCPQHHILTLLERHYGIRHDAKYLHVALASQESLSAHMVVPRRDGPEVQEIEELIPPDWFSKPAPKAAAAAPAPMAPAHPASMPHGHGGPLPIVHGNRPGGPAPPPYSVRGVQVPAAPPVPRDAPMSVDPRRQAFATLDEPEAHTPEPMELEELGPATGLPPADLDDLPAPADGLTAPPVHPDEEHAELEELGPATGLPPAGDGELMELEDLGPATAFPPPGEGPEDPGVPPPPAVLAVAPPRPTLEVGEAVALLAKVEDRDAVGDVVVDHLRAVYGAGLVFILKDDMFLGWKGFAPGVETEVLESVALPVAAPSMLRMANEGKATFRGAPPADGATLQGRLFKLLRLANPPKEVIVTPVVLGKRVVNLVYAHGKDGALLPASAASTLATVTQAAASAYARIIRGQRT